MKRKGKEKRKLEVKLWQKWKKSQMPQLGIKPGRASAAVAGVPGSIPGRAFATLSVLPKLHFPFPFLLSLSLSLRPFACA